MAANTKTGTFYGRDGSLYTVNISGSSITEGTIILSGQSPVVISMDAGRNKFVGLKSVYARVRIITDSIMSEFFSGNPLEIRMTILKASSVIFDGYVIPFSFDQPLSGRNDEVEIEAVDMLTANRYMKYTTYSGSTDCIYTALEHVNHICYLCGISYIYIQSNFGSLGGNEMSNVKISESAWTAPDEFSEPAFYTDVVSDIAKFCGYTAVTIGDSLYLYDEHCLVNGQDVSKYYGTRYTVSQAGAVSAQVYTTSASPFHVKTLSTLLGSANKVTIERPYDRIRIDTDDIGGESLMIDPLTDKVFINAGTALHSYAFVSGGNMHETVACKTTMIDSKVYDSSNAYTPDQIYANDGILSGQTAWCGCLPIVYRKTDISTYEAEARKMIWIHKRKVRSSSYPVRLFGTPVLYTKNLQYSFIRVRCSLMVRTDGGCIPPESGLGSNYQDGGFRIRCGSRYLALQTGVVANIYDWQSSVPSGTSAPKFKANGVYNDLVTSHMADIHLDSGMVAYNPYDGGISVEYMHDLNTNVTQDIFITSLSIELVGDGMKDGFLLYDINRATPAGVPPGNEELSATSRLIDVISGDSHTFTGDVRAYGLNTLRGRVITASGTYNLTGHEYDVNPYNAWRSRWSARYMNNNSIPLDMEPAGMLAYQLRSRYASAHRALQVEVPADDAELQRPVSLSSVLYTIESMTWDVERCVKKILID